MRHVHFPAQRVARAARESLAPARRIGDKARWYCPAAIAADFLGAAIPVGLVFDAAQQVRPVYCALAAAVAWTGVQALRRRYAARALGESRGVLPVVHDWLILIGVLAVARVVTEEATPRLSALGALLPALLITVAVHKLTYRHLSAARREAQAVSRVLVVGEPDAAEDVIAHLAARTDHPYVVVGVVPVGAGPLTSGIPVAARLDKWTPEAPNGDSAAVLGAVASHHADLVLVAPGVRITGERLRRIAWALHDAGLELAVFPGLVEVSVKRLETLSAGGLAVLRVAPPSAAGCRPCSSRPWTGWAPRPDCCCSPRSSWGSSWPSASARGARPSTASGASAATARRSSCGSSARWSWTPTRSRPICPGRTRTTA